MYAITGATGNTGGVIVRTLLANNRKVRAIGRTAERLDHLVDNGAEAFIADLTNVEALTKAFTGAKAVYAMIPPEMRIPDYRAYQDQTTEAIATAVERASVEYVVALSSLGADKPDKTGPVVGLRDLEQRLNQIPGLNVLCLRAGYFMENILPQIHPVHEMGKVFGAIRPDLKLPMIATHDIGTVAGKALSALDFRGKQTRELLGQRDLTMIEATEIIGKAVDRPDVSYARMSDAEFRGVLIRMGATPDMADLLIEMVQALNSGHMRALERRSEVNTTPTSFEAFVAEEFVPRFEAVPVEAGAI